MEKRMRAAGLDVMTPGPVARWRQKWGSEENVWDEDTGQTLLSIQPHVRSYCNGLAETRGAPRPDWAPPTVIPHDAQQLHLCGTGPALPLGQQNPARFWGEG